jgi:hypothetical protein
MSLDVFYIDNVCIIYRKIRYIDFLEVYGRKYIVWYNYNFWWMLCVWCRLLSYGIDSLHMAWNVFIVIIMDVDFADVLT